MPFVQVRACVAGTLAIVVLSATACATHEAMGEVRDELNTVIEQMEHLNQKIASLEESIEAVEDKLFENRMDMLSLTPTRKAFIDLTSPGGGYQHVWPESGPGMFLVSLEDAESYMQGYRLQIRIGNPMNMTFSGFELRAYVLLEKRKRQSYTQDLLPGSWHTVDLVISPLDADDAHLLMLGIITNEVRLYTR